LTKDGIKTETATRYFRAIKEYTSLYDVLDMYSTSHEFEEVCGVKYVTDDSIWPKKIIRINSIPSV